MILTKEVEVCIGSINLAYYKQKGYDCKLRDRIIIPIEDVYVGSHVKVEVQCENCNAIKSMSYENYIRNINSTDIHIYYCKKCNHLKKAELAKRKQKIGLLDRSDHYYWTFEENRIVEFKQYVKDNKSIECIKDKDYSLYNAIMKYEKDCFTFAKKLNMNTDLLFAKRKPNNYFTKEFIINCITQFIKHNKRFPSQIELISLYRISSNSFNKYFKDFNECKKEIGFYNKTDLIDNRGDTNRSYYELYTANYLIAQGLGNGYSREEYPFKEFDNKINFRSDFTLFPIDKNPIHIEVWGDSENINNTNKYFKNYLKTRKEKEFLYEKYKDNITLVQIEPSTFFGSLQTIESNLFDIFKDVLNLKFKKIDIENLLPYGSMSEENILKEIIKCSKDKTTLPSRKGISKIKGGSGLLKNIDKRFGGLGYFANKYNLKISHKNKFWNDEVVFEKFSYMIDKYNSVLNTREFKNIQDNQLVGFYNYLNASESGYINSVLSCIDTYIYKNKLLPECLLKYLIDISENKLKYYHTLKLETQQKAKQILDKHQTTNLKEVSPTL